MPLRLRHSQGSINSAQTPLGLQTVFSASLAPSLRSVTGCTPLLCSVAGGAPSLRSVTGCTPLLCSVAGGAPSLRSVTGCASSLRLVAGCAPSLCSVTFHHFGPLIASITFPHIEKCSGTPSLKRPTEPLICILEGQQSNAYMFGSLIKEGQWGHHIEKCARTPNSYTTTGKC